MRIGGESSLLLAFCERVETPDSGVGCVHVASLDCWVLRSSPWRWSHQAD